MVSALLVVLLWGAELPSLGKVLEGGDNVQILEARCWLQGRLDLPVRFWDTALYEGHIYSHFPPLFTVFSLLPILFFGGVPLWLVVLFVVAPIVVLSYRLFLMRTGSSDEAAVLTVAFLCGTSLWPALVDGLRLSNPYAVNQLLSVPAMLVLIHEHYGRRRLWLAGPALAMAALSRQLTIAYAVALCSDAWKKRLAAGRVAPSLGVAGACAIPAGTIMTLNALKFGHPLHSGYMSVYEQRDHPQDVLARDARTHGIFSFHYVPRNLYYANLGFPEVERVFRDGHPDWQVSLNAHGTGIWWTSPLLLFFPWDFRRILRDRRNAILIVSALLVFGALMCYHSTGYTQRGFNRYSLDYLPAVFAAMAPRCLKGRRMGVGVVLTIGSVVYFAGIVR